MCVCVSLTLNGCFENSIIKKMKSSKPKKDTSCLVPCRAVSSANQHTTATSSSVYTILERTNTDEARGGRMGRKWRKGRERPDICHISARRQHVVKKKLQGDKLPSCAQLLRGLDCADSRSVDEISKMVPVHSRLGGASSVSYI